MHEEMVPETSSQVSVLNGSGLLRTENSFSDMLSRKCGGLLAGLPDSCCWLCWSRSSGRWRCPVLPCRKPCTTCASRCLGIRRSLRCTAIMRWHSRSGPNPPKPRFKPPVTRTAASTIAAAAPPPPSGHDPLPVCRPS